MKKEIHTVHELDAPAAEVWSHLRTGEAVDAWLPPITACRVEGNRRYCEAGAARLEETIEESDDETMTFRYSIQQQDLLPVSDIAGTMRVEAVDDQRSRLYWDVRFEVADEATFTQVEAATRQLYVAGAQGLVALTAA